MGYTGREEEGSKHSHSHNMHVANHHIVRGEGEEEMPRRRRRRFGSGRFHPIACSEMWAVLVIRHPCDR